MITKAVAIILARAGSKGLPRKNALPIAGRPCIEWTIEAAVAARSVGSIILSTDDPELLALGRAWTDRSEGRLRTHHRPPEFAGDTATIDAAARSALAGSPHPIDPAPGLPVAILYANVPIRPPDLIDRAVELLVATSADSVQSYAPVEKYHPWWTARVDPETGAVRPWEGDVLNHGVFRRQDLPPAHIPDGGVIAVTRESLMLEIPGVRPGPHAFFGREGEFRRGIINPEGSVVDIDSRVDLLVAEAMLRLSTEEGVEATRHPGIKP